MTDPGAHALFATGIRTLGVPVTFQRLIGAAPNVTTISANVTAIIRTAVPDTTTVAETGLGASSPDAITQEDRQVLVMAGDLTAAGFPLPLVKTDRLTVIATGDTFEITRVDSYKRAISGAIEAFAAGPV